MGGCLGTTRQLEQESEVLSLVQEIPVNKTSTPGVSVEEIGMASSLKDDSEITLTFVYK